MLKIRRMKFKYIAFLIACFLSLHVSAQDIKKQLEEFREVKTFSGIEVVVIPSKENMIEITGHSKDKVKFEIVEDRLEIRLSLDNIWSDDNTLITVYGETIETIDANEGSIVKTEGSLNSEIIVLRAQEGASIFAEVNAENIRSKVVSGGNISVKGKSQSQDVEVNTGGQFFGKKLKTKETNVTVSTAGRGEVFATEYCKATAKLGGIIEISGKPDKVDYKTNLGGKIL